MPEGYLEAGHKMVDDEHYDEWVPGCRASTTRWRRSITPTWAKILDFETRIPSAVEELVREKQAAG